MRFDSFFAPLALTLVLGCAPSELPQEHPQEERPPVVSEDVQSARQFLHNIESYLSDLEDHLQISNAQTWREEASVAQHALGNIRIEMDTLKQRAGDLRNLESWLTDLEGSLRGASPDNWSQNATAARHIVGNIRIELQKLSRDSEAASGRAL